MRTLLATGALFAMCGCALEPGSPWGVLDPELTVHFEPRLDSAGQLVTDLDYALQLQRLQMTFNTVTVHAAGQAEPYVQFLEPALADLLAESQTIPERICRDDCRMPLDDDTHLGDVDIEVGFVRFDATVIDVRVGAAERLGDVSVVVTGTMPLGSVISHPLDWVGRVGRHRRVGLALPIDLEIAPQIFDGIEFADYVDPVGLSAVDVSFVAELPGLIGQRVAASSTVTASISRFDPEED